MSRTGKKYDSTKTRTDLLPPTAILSIADVLTHGAQKYGDNNWQDLDKFEQRYLGAALRHILQHMQGEDVDPESGLPHLSHAACSLVFLIEALVGQVNGQDSLARLSREREREYPQKACKLPAEGPTK